MKTTKTNKNNEMQIGDKVKFVVGTSLLTGVITKFYKNSYGDEECSVKTELNTLSGKINQKIFPHILLHRVSKIEGKDEVEVVREMRQQIVDLEQENKQLKEQLAEKYKEVNILRDKLKDLKEEITECYVDGQDYVELREQKDEEIEELKEHIKFLENKCLNEINVKLVNVTKEKMLEIRKQVCDEIREYIDKNMFKSEYDQWVILEDDIKYLLEKLEQAKESIDGK